VLLTSQRGTIRAISGTYLDARAATTIAGLPVEAAAAVAAVMATEIVLILNSSKKRPKYFFLRKKTVVRLQTVHLGYNLRTGMAVAAVALLAADIVLWKFQ
jgi:hypothetical protein